LFLLIFILFISVLSLFKNFINTFIFQLSIELEIRTKHKISELEDTVDTCISKYFQTERNGQKTVRDLENELRSKGSRCIYNFICSVSKDVKFELTWAN